MGRKLDDVEESGGWKVDGGWSDLGVALFVFLSLRPVGEAILHIRNDGRVYFSKS